MMNKYDELLNELVYEIDDLVYNFYSVSNELIAHKKGQDRLFDFRDQTVDIINTMNIRSLEMISHLKKREHVEERSDKLVAKNKELIHSSFEVIKSSPNKSELFEDLSALSLGLYESAKETIAKVEESGVVDRVVSKTKQGFEDLVNNPEVQKGTEIVKEKTKEAVNMGSKAFKEGSATLSKWFEEFKKQAKETAKNTKEAAEDVKEEVVRSADDLKDQVKDSAAEVKEASKDAVDDLKDQASDLKDGLKDGTEELSDDAKELAEDVKEGVEDKTDDLKESAEDVKEDLEDKVKEGKDIAENAFKEIKDESKDIQDDMDALFKEVKDVSGEEWEDIKESKDEIEDDIIVFLEKNEKKVRDAANDLKQEDKKDEESNDL